MQDSQGVDMTGDFCSQQEEEGNTPQKDEEHHSPLLSNAMVVHLAANVLDQKHYSGGYTQDQVGR